MLNRLVGVLYVLAAGWLVLMWFAAGGTSDNAQFKITALVLGLPPLVLLALVRFVTAGRL